MKLSARGRYAVMALVDMCFFEQENHPSIPLSLSVIAQNQGLSLAYLEQIFMKLKKTGIVTSIRGITGGYCLAHSPDDLTLADIFESVDETFTATACHSGRERECMPNRGRCVVHHVWKDLEMKVYDYLQSVTLSSIVISIKKGKQPGESCFPDAPLRIVQQPFGSLETSLRLFEEGK